MEGNEVKVYKLCENLERDLSGQPHEANED
jgi:hypothetical protein